ncbi:MAG: DUF1080 domain-containing protein [Kiritimatiellae bacterium]|jgi:hypothetical protein|nr:DUF1080 domain-containing protein [Kiritimatiellia bacterium]
MKHLSIILLSLLTAASVNAREWKNLFDGKTLKGWEQHGGQATYKVADSTIVGTSTPNTANTFLCTDREYGDFVLEYEYFPHASLNCGVQFRSQIREKNDRVWGYQCEIDPSARKWSAGIYEEAGRGWLYPVEAPEAQAAYKPGVWNKVRIVCLGPVTRTYLNDIPVAELVDDANKKGIIGLQVHGVGSNTTPMSIKWRNLRIMELNTTDTAEVIAADTDTMGARPARGADILLAPGKGLDAWQLRPAKVPWMNKYEEGNLQWSVDKEKGVATPMPFAGSMDTKKHFETQRIHIEFCTPPLKEGDSPEISGNSGVYLQGSYELQICNSFGLEVASNLCGGLYKQRVPDVNAAGKPGEWQTYDIYFIPAKFDGDKKSANARMSAKLNGKWVHRDIEITGPTGSGDRETPGPHTLRLQEHQHLVKFRNTWVSDIDNPTKLTNYDPRTKK